MCILAAIKGHTVYYDIRVRDMAQLRGQDSGLGGIGVVSICISDLL